MKKFVMGLIVGVAIAASATAFADEIESIIGKTVEGQFPVKIDGVTLDKQAAVIDGTSYLPVRAIGESIGREVSFDADLGIELKVKEKEVAPVTQEATDKPMTEEEKKTKISVLENKILKLTLDINGLKYGLSIESNKQSPLYAEWERILPERESELAKLQAELEELKKQ